MGDERGGARRSTPRRRRRLASGVGAVLLAVGCGGGADVASTGTGASPRLLPVDDAPLDLPVDPPVVDHVELVADEAGVLAVAVPVGGLADTVRAAAWFDAASRRWERLPRPPFTDVLAVHGRATPLGPLLAASHCDGRFVEDLGCGGRARTDLAVLDVAAGTWRPLPSLSPDASALVAAPGGALGSLSGGGTQQLVEVRSPDLGNRELWTLDVGAGRWRREVGARAERATFCRPSTVPDVYAVVDLEAPHAVNGPESDDGRSSLRVERLPAGSSVWEQLGPDDLRLSGEGAGRSAICGREGITFAKPEAVASVDADGLVDLPDEGAPTTPWARGVSTWDGGVVAIRHDVAGPDGHGTDITVVRDGRPTSVRVPAHVSGAALPSGGDLLVEALVLGTGARSWSVLELPGAGAG